MSSTVFVRNSTSNRVTGLCLYVWAVFCVIAVIFITTERAECQPRYIWKEFPMKMSVEPKGEGMFNFMKYPGQFLSTSNSNDTVLLTFLCTFNYHQQETKRFSVIYYSIDSGSTWHPYSTFIEADTIPYGAMLRVFRTGENSLFSVGYVSNHVSTDNGRRWNRIKDTTLYSFHSTSFYGRFGVASVPYLFNIFYTDDGGSSWRKIHNHDTSQHWINSLYLTTIADSTSLYIRRYNPWTETDTPSNGTKFYSTENKGSTWQNLGSTIEGFEGDSANDAGILQIEWLSSSTGVGVGWVAKSYRNDKSQHAIFRTTNFGRSWYVVDRGPEYGVDLPDSLLGRYIGLARVGTDTLIASFVNGAMKISRDAGKTWAWHVRENTLVRYDGKLVYPTPNMNQKFFWNSGSALTTVINSYDATIMMYRLVPVDSTTAVGDGVESRTHGATVWIEMLSPQPTVQRLTVQSYLRYGNEPERLHVEIFDMLGSRVADYRGSLISIQPHEWGVGWYNVTIPLYNMADGVYVVQISDGTQQRSRSFIHVSE